eukprot:m.719691 g.719691  ORF g.719691 m.719691 type:complete len:561 (+) comp23001_c0_seq25:851-2533(+)
MLRDHDVRCGARNHFSCCCQAHSMLLHMCNVLTIAICCAHVTRDGVGGRSVRYDLVCNATLPAHAGPTVVAENQGGPYEYLVTWQTPLACVTAAAPSESCSQDDTPQPTPDQLRFQEMEIGALVCYNMATTTGSQGCSAHSVPPVSAFTDVAPTKVNTDQWCAAIASFGAKYATLVAKHVCGFAIWPTKAGLPARNWTYMYSVPADRDIVRAFAESCSGVGVQLGLYYSVVSNTYLNVQGGVVLDPSTAQPGQQVVTQEEYADIVEQQLTELWTNYGDLAEIWFDGGFAVPSLQDKLLGLLNKTQPHACVFNGCGLSRNAIEWIGTESGHAPGPIWNPQTGCASGAGTPGGHSYIPKEVDLTLQNADTWFFHEGTGYRELHEMVGIYHDSVGKGGNMLLNVAPPPNSTIPDVAMTRYANLGKFIRTCYGQGSEAAPTAIASTQQGCTDCWNISLSLAHLSVPAAMDRFIIKEELSGGQLVRSYSILVDDKIVYNGTLKCVEELHGLLHSISSCRCTGRLSMSETRHVESVSSATNVAQYYQRSQGVYSITLQLCTALFMR